MHGDFGGGDSGDSRKLLSRTAKTVGQFRETTPAGIPTAQKWRPAPRSSRHRLLSKQEQCILDDVSLLLEKKLDLLQVPHYADAAAPPFVVRLHSCRNSLKRDWNAEYQRLVGQCWMGELTEKERHSQLLELISSFMDVAYRGVAILADDISCPSSPSDRTARWTVGGLEFRLLTPKQTLETDSFACYYRNKMSAARIRANCAVYAAGAWTLHTELCALFCVRGIRVLVTASAPIAHQSSNNKRIRHSNPAIHPDSPTTAYGSNDNGAYTRYLVRTLRFVPRAQDSA